MSSSAAHIGEQTTESAPKKLHYDFLTEPIILVETVPMFACMGI